MLGIWIALAILFAFIELATPQLVSIWFCVAALFSLISIAFGASVWVQIVVFVVTSLLLLVLTRPLYKKYLMPKVIKTNADALVGEDAVVIIEINNDDATGQVKVRGQIWSAQSKSGLIIPLGEKVVVEGISGVKLMVTKKPVSDKQSQSEQNMYATHACDK